MANASDVKRGKGRYCSRSCVAKRGGVPASERFWPKVEFTEHCWLWRGAISSKGYGNFWDGSRYVPAHIFAYTSVVGPVPEGHVLDHVRARGCTNRHCVNPAHLEPVTPTENTLRGESPAAQAARRDTCMRGHPFTPENTRRMARGERQCRTCDRDRHRDSSARRRSSVPAQERPRLLRPEAA